MKLRKPIRKQLREAAAKHESMTITWPESAPDPIPGHKYAVKGFDSETRLEVQSAKEVRDNRWEATVRLDSDPIRGLRIKARKGPENVPLGGPQFRAEAEPEQVSARYQRLLDEEGRLKTTLAGATQRQNSVIQAKEQRLRESTSSARSRKAQERHIRRQEAA